MNQLLDTSNALAHPVTQAGVLTAGIALALTPVIAFALRRLSVLSEPTSRDVWKRYLTWLVLAPLMMVPLLACPLSAIVGVLIMSLLCYREFARATGLFRERLLSAMVTIAVISVAIASTDNWYRFYVALAPLTITLLAAAAVLKDRPQGYLQRVSLAALSFLIFGAGLGHLGYMANDADYRPVLVLLVMSSQISDIAAYCFGKTFGRHKLFPNTSPNKTLEGHLGALLVVAPLSAYGAHVIFKGTAAGHPLVVAGLGLIIAVGAQLGDLVLGSIKRDIGIKDMSATLPGHGGFLDRFNSLLLISPAAFHYLYYMGAFHFPQAVRFTEGMP